MLLNQRAWAAPMALIPHQWYDWHRIARGLPQTNTPSAVRMTGDGSARTIRHEGGWGNMLWHTELILTILNGISGHASVLDKP
ncbi:hypothetical protein GCM10009602_70140 [Nocardiopsis tropica]